MEWPALRLRVVGPGWLWVTTKDTEPIQILSTFWTPRDRMVDWMFDVATADAKKWMHLRIHHHFRELVLRGLYKTSTLFYFPGLNVSNTAGRISSPLLFIAAICVSDIWMLTIADKPLLALYLVPEGRRWSKHGDDFSIIRASWTGKRLSREMFKHFWGLSYKQESSALPLLSYKIACVTLTYLLKVQN